MWQQPLSLSFLSSVGMHIGGAAEGSNWHKALVGGSNPGRIAFCYLELHSFGGHVNTTAFTEEIYQQHKNTLLIARIQLQVMRWST